MEEQRLSRDQVRRGIKNEFGNSEYKYKSVYRKVRME
jgi:hypothetical protein